MPVLLLSPLVFLLSLLLLSAAVLEVVLEVSVEEGEVDEEAGSKLTIEHFRPMADRNWCMP